MKNLLKFALAICLIFVFSDIQAQVKFGPRVGLNLSTMTMKSMEVSIDPKMLVGFSVGGLFEIPLSDNLFLQPAVLYSTKGSKYSIMSIDFQISPSFIEIPVNLVYKFDFGNVKLLINAGPYTAYGISGKAKSSGESVDINFGNNETDDLNTLDFGINAGAGVEISNIIISANYGLGLTNLMPVTNDNGKIKTRVIGFSVAYLFGSK